MQDADFVTFGGGCLDRAASSRGDERKMAELIEKSMPRVIVYCKGRLLMQPERHFGLVKLRNEAPLVKAATSKSMFLGLRGRYSYFAQDVDHLSESELADLMPSGATFEDLRAVMANLTSLDAELAVSTKALFEWHAIHGFCAACGHKSTITMQGWQRDCPACGRRHFPRTDPVVIMLVVHENKVLLGRSPGWPEGMYSLLAGFVEPGETLEMAARREVLEESNVKIGRVRYLASQPWPFPASLMVGCYCEAESTDITVDPDEIEDAFWLGRDALMEVFAGTNSDISPARPGSIAHFLIKNWLADRFD